MGYRSEVAFVIRGPKDALVARLTTFRLAYKDPEKAKEAIDACTYHGGGDELTIRYHAEDIKWYPSYEDIDALKALFETFRELHEESEIDCKINGSFARIGEENDDVDQKSFGHEPYELVQVCRSMAIDCGPGKSLTEALAAEAPNEA